MSGDRVVAFVRVSGQGRASGAAVDARSAWLARVAEGQGRPSLRLYRDPLGGSGSRLRLNLAR